MTGADTARSLDNLKLERDAIVLYDALASIEKDERRANAFRTIAGNERRHAEIWASKLREQGVEVPPPSPPRRAPGWTMPRPTSSIRWETGTPKARLPLPGE